MNRYPHNICTFLKRASRGLEDSDAELAGNGSIPYNQCITRQSGVMKQHNTTWRASRGGSKSLVPELSELVDNHSIQPNFIHGYNCFIQFHTWLHDITTYGSTILLGEQESGVSKSKLEDNYSIQNDYAYYYITPLNNR